MENFNREGGGGFDRGRGGGGFGGRDSGGGNSSGKSWGGGRPWDNKPKMMHKAICSNCGRSCEVPFRPNGSKPVFCNDCFGKMKEGGPSGNFLSNNFVKKDFSPRPSSQPPQSQVGDRRIDELKKQLDLVNTKLDALLKAVEKTVSTETLVEAKKTTLKKLVKKGALPKKK